MKAKVRKKTFAVAIDGPAGAGKTTMAKKLAYAMSNGFIYVDTGALYRAVAYYIVEKDKLKIDPDNKTGAIAAIPDDITACLNEISLELVPDKNAQTVLLNGEDVTGRLRTPEISMMASAVSANARVRDFLLGLQKDIAKTHNVVMEGRDIGTTILPDADVKFYLDAKPEERARRRQYELSCAGVEKDFDELLAEINKRDYDDMHREISPLAKSPDAVVIDSTAAGTDATFERMLEYVKDAFYGRYKACYHK